MKKITLVIWVMAVPRVQQTSLGFGTTQNPPELKQVQKIYLKKGGSYFSV